MVLLLLCDGEQLIELNSYPANLLWREMLVTLCYVLDTALHKTKLHIEIACLWLIRDWLYIYCIFIVILAV